jgi:hypothetical protein
MNRPGFRAEAHQAFHGGKLSLSEVTGLILDKAVAWTRSREAAAQVELKGGRVFTAKPLTPLLVAVLYRLCAGPMVVAVSGEAAALASDIGSFVPGEVSHLPSAGPVGDWFHPYEEAVGQRHKAARSLRAGKIAVAGVEALLGGMPVELPRQWPLELGVGMEMDLEGTLNLLVQGGYQREYTVE